MPHTKLTSRQIAGFWGAWSGWTLDGMDSFIYALVLSPALTELLPKSGIAKTPENVGLAGSILFALFLIGWGISFIWGPIADRFGRTRVLAATILAYAVFTGAAALAANVWQLGLFRLFAGIGIGGEWALAGTYVAEAWPEDRRKMGAGYLQTGYYFGFFLAAALNYTIGARFGWRAMFLCGLSPVIVSILITARVKEPKRWKHRTVGTRHKTSLAEIFNAKYRRRTIVNAALLTVAIIGLWAGAVYEPTAIITLAKSRHVPDASFQNSVDRNRDSFFRNYFGLPRSSGFGGAPGAKENSGDLFCGHVGVHIAQFWLGVLSGKRTETIHRLLVFPRFFWRQLCAIQFVAPRAVRDRSPCHGLFVRNFLWPVHRSRCQLPDRRDGAQRRNAGQTGRLYRARIRVGAFDHSLRGGNARPDLAELNVDAAMNRSVYSPQRRSLDRDSPGARIGPFIW